jgi:RNA methyltransferase, TrmH family
MGSLFTQPVLARRRREPARGAARARRAHRRDQPRRTGATGRRRSTASVAIVVGPEHAGLDEAWLAAADALVAMPMRGSADSLNVATAGALVLFEALRRASCGGPA